MTQTLKLIGIFTITFILLSGSSQPGFSENENEGHAQSLYARLGGQPAIQAIVTDFVARAISDSKVNFTRKGTDRPWIANPENVELLKKHLVQFFCSAAGGPEKYEGQDMKTAHFGRKITTDEFDTLVEDLKSSFDKFNVGEEEQKELLSTVESTRAEIVEEVKAPEIPEQDLAVLPFPK